MGRTLFPAELIAFEYFIFWFSQSPITENAGNNLSSFSGGL
jgi:hypothetical protein